jgi:nucleoside-diphosphate-sugar epimerase
MKILVTGSNSKIGAHLIKKLRASGNEIIEFDGKGSKIWKLGEGIPKNSQADVLIHLAHDRNFSVEENVNANQEICSSFAGSKIFLSSLSAHRQSESKYGKSKFESESVFLYYNSSVLRAGIVYGKDVDGIMEKISKILRFFPVIPLPYGGNNLFYTSQIDDLVDEIIWQIYHPSQKIIFAANSYPISFYNLIHKISEFNHFSRFLVPLPRQPIDFFLKYLLKFIRNTSFADTILSLKTSVDYTELSLLRQPLTEFREFELKR